MTIEVGFVPEGREDKVALPALEAGMIATFSDFSTGTQKVISAFCYPDDSGGEVYIFDNEGFIQSSGVRLIPADAYTKEALDANIPPGGIYERNITTETRKKGRLILQHVRSN